MTNNLYRLLGFAFASADLFIEVDERGVLGFALGAGQKVCGRPEVELGGLHWRDIIAEADQAMVEGVLASFGPAERRGPMNVRIRHSGQGDRHASLSFGRLPPQTTISMAFSLSIPETISVGQGVLDPSQFVTDAEQLLHRARLVDKRLELSLVEVSGIEAARTTMTLEQARQLDDKIVGAVRAQSYAGALVGKLGDQSYALVRPEGDSEELLTERLNQSLRVMLDEVCGVSAVVKPFALPGSEATNPVLALRCAMDAVAKQGPAAGQSLAEAVSQSIRSTLTQATAFQAVVAERRFKLAYQPVVLLATQALHHYEVLVRFAAGESPQDTILMAEDLDLIEQLDWAILSETLQKLGAPGNKLKLAINISGRSISSPVFMSRLRQAAQRVNGASKSLLFEITESSKIEDFDLVDRHIQDLRKDGHTVCLDDFGAGAASFAYLQRLQVDVVKVDGQYIKALDEPRQRAMVSHVVDMCRALGVATIAEMIETDAIADAARQVGFDYGQGYLFGKPALKPELPRTAVASVPARRRGAVEMWG